MNKPRVIALTYGLLVTAVWAFADNGDSFVTGFANGLSQALAARQGYQQQPSYDYQQYQRMQQEIQLEEQIRLLREQVDLQRQQLQQQQTEDILKFRDSLGR